MRKFDLLDSDTEFYQISFSLISRYFFFCHVLNREFHIIIQLATFHLKYLWSIGRDEDVRVVLVLDEFSIGEVGVAILAVFPLRNLVGRNELRAIWNSSFNTFDNMIVGSL